MKEVILNGTDITCREDIHRILAAGLDFPEWYGGNLDAMHDCLTDLRDEVIIRVQDVEALEATLDSYARRLMRVLCDASAENPRIQLVTE